MMAPKRFLGNFPKELVFKFSNPMINFWTFTVARQTRTIFIFQLHQEIMIKICKLVKVIHIESSVVLKREIYSM